MFIIEKQEIKNKKLNYDTMQWEEVEPYYNTPCGSDYTVLCTDLKTLRGVLNRYKEWIIRKPLAYDIQRIAVYQVSNWTVDTSRIEPIYTIDRI